jgi:hypothetical protein
MLKLIIFIISKFYFPYLYILNERKLKFENCTSAFQMQIVNSTYCIYTQSRVTLYMFAIPFLPAHNVNESHAGQAKTRIES